MAPTPVIEARPATAPTTPVVDAPRRSVDHRRLTGAVTIAALAASVLAAVGQALGSVVIGRVAERPAWSTVGVLAACVVGAALLDTVGRVAWTGVIDRAEGRLRADLLDAVMAQPVSELTEQAVGEILDRIDDDTHELGTLLRISVWRVIRVGMLVPPLVIVAGLTWWPAWILFPLVATAVVATVRPLLAELARLKVAEEAAWSDHAAAMEEGIAARDDLRTSLGQPFVVRRSAELAAAVHDRMRDVVRVEARIMLRTGTILASLLVVVVVGGVALADADRISTAMLVTLFAVTATFVGQIDQVAHHLPDLQSGVGALIRLRGLMAVAPEPAGGRPAPAGPVSVEFRDLHFHYEHGSFALDGVSLEIPAGTTCAFVGRSGSGKTTTTMLLSRAVDPPPGTVFLDGVDVTELELDSLRSTVGLVTQRTEILSATLAENVALFADVGRGRIEAAIEELGIASWVAGLPDGLDTRLGAGGTTLSAGEEQLVAFARLLVRDVGVIVLDEATARMDPVTEGHVVEAAQRLLHGRTGIIVAHRLGTTERADRIAVFDAGRIVEQGERRVLADADGPFARLLRDAGSVETTGLDQPGPVATAVLDAATGAVHRRSAEPPPPPEVPEPPSLASGVRKILTTRPEWGALAIACFVTFSLFGAFGVITSWIWGRIVVALDDGDDPTVLVVVIVIGLLTAPLLLAAAVRRFPHWWIAVLLRVRMSVLVAQTGQHRLEPTPPGEVVARTLDADRYARIGDRWFDFVSGLLIATLAGVLGGTPVAAAVLLGIMATTAALSAIGSPLAGRTAAASSAARARFGRALVSTLDAIRTVKLSASTAAVQRHLGHVDGGRVDAAVREHRIQSALDGVPVVLVQLGVVAAWAVYTSGGWSLATALLVSGAVLGYEWFGRVAGAVITETPGTRAWQQATSRLAAGRDLMHLPTGVDLVHGTAPPPDPIDADPLVRLELVGLEARHPDGTVGVHHVDLTVDRGELVLLLGRVGSGKSSLLAALAGLVHSTGIIRWNGHEVTDRQSFLRPRRIGYVAQVPRVVSGTFADNIRLDHPDRPIDVPIAQARLERDIADAGGPDSLVGHRGVRLSGGQTQRLALARAIATRSEVLVADDVSSALDATTEIELWEAMRSSGRTVIGSTTKAAALARADRVVVLDEGTIVAAGPWSELAGDWSHLAG